MNTITNLAKSNLKKEKGRSRLLLLTIGLTAMLLSVIATFGYGLAKMNRQNAEEWYGAYYGTYRDVTEESIRQMRLRSEFTQIGLQAVLGEAENEKALVLIQVDEGAITLTGMDGRLTEGAYPQKGNEITAQPGFFKALGVENPRIGDQVEIWYRTGKAAFFAPDTFVISGLIAEPESVIPMDGYSACVSREYFESRIPRQDREYKVYFRLDPDLPVNSDNAESVMKELAEACGIDEKGTEPNKGFLVWALDPGVDLILGCGMVAILVFLFSIMVLYNIFQVGTVRRVQEFGKLKAIGATRKQLRQILFREGLLLTFAAAPVGCVLGFGTGELFLRLMVKLRSDADLLIINVPLSFNLPLLMLCFVFTFLTVWAALKKPMRLASSISPVEAMRYGEAGGKRKLRKGRKELKVSGLTMANLAGSRKRTFFTILSMGLSCVLFLVLANLLGNMDAEYDARIAVNYGQLEVKLDYDVGDLAYPENNLDVLLKNNPLSDEFVEAAGSLEHVTGVKQGYLFYADMVDEQGREIKGDLTVAVLNRQDMEREAGKGGIMGSTGYDEISAENGLLVSWSHSFENYGFELGDPVTLRLWDGRDEIIWNTKVVGAFGSAPGHMAMAEDTFRKLNPAGNIRSRVWIDCAPSDVDAVTQELGELLGKMNHVRLNSYRDALSLSEMSFRMLKILGYSICLFIAFISFINMMNTIITSVLSRKREFGVLQAVGMTNRQLNASLRLEGLLYTLGTVLCALLAGVPLGYSLFLWGKDNGIIGLYQYHFPVAETFLMVAVIAVMQLMLSCVLSRNVRKESLVERIRYQD